MDGLQEKVYLVVPCYNESRRLKMGDFLNSSPNCSFLFVNDGSSDNTLEVIENAKNDSIHILNLKRNYGKAEAIRQGMLYLENTGMSKHAHWVGYWDADLSTSLNEVQHFIAYSNLFTNEVDAIFGSRIYKLGSTISRSFKRHILGRVFATFLYLLLRVGSYDSQCGAKLFRSELIIPIFARPFLSRWIFDVEILLRLKDFIVVEYPILKWKDVKDGKLNVFTQAASLFYDLVKISVYYRFSGFFNTEKNTIKR